MGPFETPTRVLSLIEFERVFGATGPGELADQVRQFYVNGGTEAWIEAGLPMVPVARIPAGAVTGGTALPATRFAFASDRPALGAA